MKNSNGNCTFSSSKGVSMPMLMPMLMLMLMLAVRCPEARAYVAVVPFATTHNTGSRSAMTIPRSTTGAFAVLRASNGNDDDDDDEEIFVPTQNSPSLYIDNNENDRDNTMAGTTTTTTNNSSSSSNSNNNSNNNNSKAYLDDLTPPPVNFARNSILFSENPSTKARNNAPLKLWKFSRTYLPAIVTGAWPWRCREIGDCDDRPLAALYNMVVVRLPVVGVACAYLYQKIAKGHDLILDFGLDASGPQPIPPVLVLGVLVLILL